MIKNSTPKPKSEKGLGTQIMEGKLDEKDLNELRRRAWAWLNESGIELPKKNREDIVSDAVAKALVAAQNGKYKEQGKFLGWYKRVVDNTARTALKKHNKRKENELIESNLPNEGGLAALCKQLLSQDLPDAEETLHTADRERLCDELIDTLPENHRYVVRAWMEGKSLAQVADELGRTQDCVRKWWQRARETLRDYAVCLDLEDTIHEMLKP